MKILSGVDKGIRFRSAQWSGYRYGILYSLFSEFSIASGGLYEIKRHASSAHHIEAENCKITNLVCNAQSTLEKSVIHAETMFAFAVAEHNEVN